MYNVRLGESMESLTRRKLYDFMKSKGIFILKELYENGEYGDTSSEKLTDELKNIYSCSLEKIDRIEDDYLFRIEKDGSTSTMRDREKNEIIFESVYDVRVTEKSSIQNNPYEFNKKIKESIKESNESIDINKLMKLKIFDYDNIKNIDKYKELSGNRVFLSYAYEDKAYTLALFLYFLKKGIYLYIDWMHNSKIPKGTTLKKKLNENLKKCNQLLLLRSINMELNIRGNSYIRPWCSWEIGNFYMQSNGKDKFYLGVYGTGPKIYKSTNIPILEGLKLFTSVKHGKLC